MAEQTSHYGLIKPTYDEHADVEVLNENMDTIDEQIYAANTSVRAVNRGGTGAATAAEARTNLGLGDVLDDVDGLKDALGSARFIYKQLSSNSNATYTFTKNCAYVILVSGSAPNVRCIIYGYCTSSGGVSNTKVDAGSSSSITLTTETNKLTINNAYSSSAYALLIRIAGTAPT